jgi:hypothetical protein
MLTVQIDDASLEQLIYTKARAIGKTTQQFVKDLLTKSLNETQELGFTIPHLDYREHIKTIDFDIKDDQISKENTPLYSQIGDAGEYVHQLRRQPRH